MMIFKNKLIESLKLTINSLEDENTELKEKVKLLERDRIILLENSKELREKIKDLENNIELLRNTYMKEEQKEEKPKRGRKKKEVSNQD